MAGCAGKEEGRKRKTNINVEIPIGEVLVDPGCVFPGCGGDDDGFCLAGFLDEARVFIIVAQDVLGAEGDVVIGDG